MDIEEELEIMNWMDRNGLSKRNSGYQMVEELARSRRPPIWRYVLAGTLLTALGFAVIFVQAH